MKKLVCMLMLIICITMPTIKSEAADMLYRFTHNDHDVLIVGTITYIDEAKIKADVATTIVSTEYMNRIDKRVQRNPNKVTIDITNLVLDKEFKVGDYILASLDKELLDYRIANGLYKVDSLDIKNLKILCEKEERIPDIAAIEYFVNSNGVINEFTFSKDSIKMKDKDGNEFTIYQKDEDGFDETVKLQETSTMQEVLSKDYDDAMVVTILLTAGIMIVIISIKYRKKVND